MPLNSLQAEEEAARQVAEKERQRQEKESKKQRRREELGDDYVSEEETEEEEGGEGEGDAPPAEKVEKPKGPSSILSTFFDHRDESKFWVSMVSYTQCNMYYIHVHACILFNMTLLYTLFKYVWLVY